MSQDIIEVKALDKKRRHFVSFRLRFLTNILVYCHSYDLHLLHIYYWLLKMLLHYCWVK